MRFGRKRTSLEIAHENQRHLDQDICVLGTGFNNLPRTADETKF